MNMDFQEVFNKVSGKLQAWFEAAAEMLPNFVVAIVVVVAFGLLARLIGRWTTKALSRWMDNEPVSELLGTIARITVVAIGVFIALGMLQLEKTVTSLLAGVGVIGLALGFAFQDIAANFMSGLLMAFRGPFDVGDVVEIGDHMGTVQAIELRATFIKTFQGQVVIIPNKDVYQNDVVNYTVSGERRIDIEVGVAYGDDLRSAVRALETGVSTLDYRDSSRDIGVYVAGFGDSSINLVVQMWLDLSTEQSSFLTARSEMVIAIKKALDEAGLTIPFPIRTLDFGAGAVGGETLHAHPLKFADAANAERQPAE